jgi:hypothetical protein
MNRATEQMNTYKPADHEATTSVAPLVQFFELVHLGDTIQSIVQVYFDKELVGVLIAECSMNFVIVRTLRAGTPDRPYRLSKSCRARKETFRKCPGRFSGCWAKCWDAGVDEPGMPIIRFPCKES